MNYTPNCRLPAWEESDRIRMEDFNDMTAKLDAALTAEQAARQGADAAEEKARQEADAAEQAARQKAIAAEQKARQDAIAAEQTARKNAVTAEQTARSQGLAALSARIDKLGNCKIYHCTYTGSGTYGTPNTHTFPGLPLIFFLSSVSGGAAIFAPYGVSAADGGTAGATYAPVSLTWSGNTVSWSNNKSASWQFNAQGAQYRIIALLAADA